MNIQPIQGSCNCVLRMNHSRKKQDLEDKSNLESIHDIPFTENKTQRNSNFEDSSGLDYKHTTSNSNAQLDIRIFVC